ncbi:hypothetical protein EON65_36705 [archaeon]|nr:MAG: hypothetical protein EON65_36705 [archaeon]
MVPQSLWTQAQAAETALWASVDYVLNPVAANDRAQEHWEALRNFEVLVRDMRVGLGMVVEAVAGS